ncbi:Ppx/GppA phosphatase family protein [Colwellia sp. 1_MG-2023]|uniref:Ppx/GppA phosphatase family protein n=1 Tax=Colwellia sp. 1_MG-2023 TaxID=3062649 RepID=UPI0026E13BF2|nr:Ppx/GppA phosphatase family protein [Colwellia sp. 1_MG-2023]MDO6444438.1 Ppx/GppA phosphatase family protein [Colwellia sp. 1_MG-2023]
MKTSRNNEASIPAEQYIAALDIGSNSFHFVLARQLGEHVQIIHCEKYRVKLAQGLDHNNVLSQEAIERGLSTLENLATTTQNINKKNFRAVATYTLRQAQNSGKFIQAASKVFPFNIEIISGHEEARLIYQGVAHHRQHNEQQLVIDIGGGSTECIIGEQYKVKALDSLNIGCVSYQQQFFQNGIISAQAFEQAIHQAKHQVESIAKRFKKLGWKHVIGTSGTIKAIVNIINYNQQIPHAITLKELNALKLQCLNFHHFDELLIEGLKESRRPVICAGLAILIALMEVLEISRLDYCQYALREGVLFEHIENNQHNNVRQRTITDFIERFNIDIPHALAVEQIAMKIFTAVKKAWQLHDNIYQELLQSAIKLHELGLDINTSGYQKHGQYIIEQADLPGFNQEQQKALAWLVGNQRKKITPLNDEQWSLLNVTNLEKLVIIIRLSALLSQQRHLDDDYLLAVSNTPKTLTLTFKEQWLFDRPIIDTELFYEKQAILSLNMRLTIKN